MTIYLKFELDLKLWGGATWRALKHDQIREYVRSGKVRGKPHSLKSVDHESY